MPGRSTPGLHQDVQLVRATQAGEPRRRLPDRFEVQLQAGRLDMGHRDHFVGELAEPQGPPQRPELPLELRFVEDAVADVQLEAQPRPRARSRAWLSFLRAGRARCGRRPPPDRRCRGRRAAAPRAGARASAWPGGRHAPVNITQPGHDRVSSMGISTIDRVPDAEMAPRREFTAPWRSSARKGCSSGSWRITRAGLLTSNGMNGYA